MRRWSLGLPALTALLWPLVLRAQIIPLIPQSGTIGGCSFVTGDFDFNCFPLYLAYLIQVVFGVLGTIALLMIIWSGYEWGTSQLAGGDVSKAKSRLVFAIQGFVFSVLSYLIVNTIISALFG